MKSFYDFPELKKNYRSERLGCVMLKTTSPLKNPYHSLPSAFIAEEYHSDNPNLSHITGIQVNHHVTVRYGFLPEVPEYDLQYVIDCINRPAGKWAWVNIIDFEVFESKIEEENYECVVALLDPNSILGDLHKQFGVLPNLATFPEYKPHVTIGYFNKGFWSEYGAFHSPLRDEVILGDWKISTAGDFKS